MQTSKEIWVGWMSLLNLMGHTDFEDNREYYIDRQRMIDNTFY